MNQHAPAFWGVECRICGAQLRFVDRSGDGESVPLARNVLCTECGNAERYASDEFHPEVPWSGGR